MHKYINFRVFKAKENESLNEMINLVVHNYELNRTFLRITIPNSNNDLEGNVKCFFDIKAKLKEVRKFCYYLKHYMGVPIFGVKTDSFSQVNETLKKIF